MWICTPVERAEFPFRSLPADQKLQNDNDRGGNKYPNQQAYCPALLVRITNHPQGSQSRTPKPRIARVRQQCTK